MDGFLFADLDKCYEVITKAVRVAGEMIKKKIWMEKSFVRCKSSEIDLVTDVDRDVEKYLMKMISINFPKHLFICEESVVEGEKCRLTAFPTWIIDPIDGTMNFVHGYPNVCISVALFVDKEAEIGIIYNPVLGHLFEARKGKGATMNGKPIQVSRNTILSEALIGFEYGTSRDEDKTRNVIKNITNLIEHVHGIRGSGSAALNMAMVAMGAFDAYAEFGTHAWDVAAGELIVREAGGVVLDPTGDRFDLFSRRVLCAGTEDLALILSEKLVQFYPPPD